ncbi:MAG TPA: COX15/CtaA family protein, partial [Gemmatimonadales bacterium]|nr:COX15/CtaA family protein [Gemmatimonadales bacterium]
IVEFIHRIRSAIALVPVLLLVIACWRTFAPGHWARKTALAATVLMGVEAGIGAALVLLKYVGDNASIGRALILGVHLANTLLLLAAIAFTAWWASGRPAPALTALGKRGWWFAAALAAFVAVGMVGTVASLGDMLFPVRSLAAGLLQDRDSTAHLFLRLRVWHPVLAILAGSGFILLAGAAIRWRDEPAVRAAARAVVTMVLVQWCVGASALILLVPVALQLLHLLTADLLWLALIWLTAAVFSTQTGRTSPATRRAASASNTVPAPSSR